MRQYLASTDRFHTDFGWLDSRHSFSFGGWWDPSRTGFSALRVINDDRVQGGSGFGTHPHRDMEILSYVVDGALEHKDSMGTGSVIRPGELQAMRAGTGVTHSEWNPSKTDEVRFLQIWIQPARTGLPPRYQQAEFPLADRAEREVLLASPDGANGSLEIAQDARLFGRLLGEGETEEITVDPSRKGWLQVVRGAVTVDGQPLAEGDGLAWVDESALTVTATAAAELLRFDLP